MMPSPIQPPEPTIGTAPCLPKQPVDDKVEAEDLSPKPKESKASGKRLTTLASALVKRAVKKGESSGSGTIAAHDRVVPPKVPARTGGTQDPQTLRDKLFPSPEPSDVAAACTGGGSSSSSQLPR